MANWRLMQTNQPLDWRSLRKFYICFVCAERRFRFSRHEIFLFYLCWRKINVVLFNVVYFVLWTGPLWKWFPGAHILWSTITSTPTFFIFYPKGRHEAQDPPPPPSLKGAETVAVYPSLKRIFDLHSFYHSLKSADLKTPKKKVRTFRNICKNIQIPNCEISLASFHYLIPILFQLNNTRLGQDG